MSSTVGSNTTSYVWDVAAGLPVILQDGTNTYVYGLGLISTYDGDAMTYRLTDGLGSTVNLCDALGNVLVTYAYDAFGAIRSETGSSSNYWKFTGEQRDSESGFDFLRARYYDPEVGRFLGQDPAGQGANPYAYALNNPANLVDPTGLWTYCAQWDSSLSDHESGQFVCAVPIETNTVGPNWIVYDSENQEWVPPFAAEIWEKGDVVCSDLICVSQVLGLEAIGRGPARGAESYVEAWAVWSTSGKPSASLQVCENAWQDQMGSLKIQISGCTALPGGDDRLDNVLKECVGGVLFFGGWSGFWSGFFGCFGGAIGGEILHATGQDK
jgi:RHS repeat-associated protein